MKTVLIIEDNLEIRENTTEILQLERLAVITAENGSDGVSLAKTTSPDIILCDIMMPGLNGYEVIRELKQDPSTASIPFIYVTASGEKTEVKQAMEMGANGFLRKPFDARDLMQLIKEHLA